MLPTNAQRRVFDRLNKTLGAESKISLVHNQEKGRTAVLKKIVVYTYSKSGFHRLNRKSRRFFRNIWKVIFDH